MAAMNKYQPPEFDPASLTPLPFVELGSTAVAANMLITGVASFPHISQVEYAVLRSLAACEASDNRVLPLLASYLEEPIGNELCPKDFADAIAEGSVAILPYDGPRVATYVKGIRPPLHQRKLKAALTLCIRGSFTACDQMTSPFMQEVTYFYSGRRLIRPIAPDCGLSQAADELLEIKRTAGELPPAETTATPHLRTWARRRN